MVKDYVVFDLETTGLSPDKDTIIEIGALKVIQGKVADRFSEFINPHQKLTQQISELTGITDDMLAGARNLQVVVGDFVDFCEDYVVVGHNLGFDYRFTKMAAEKYHLPFEHEGIDTLKIAKTVHKDLPSRSLGALCEHYGIEGLEDGEVSQEEAEKEVVRAAARINYDTPVGSIGDG